MEFYLFACLDILTENFPFKEDVQSLQPTGQAPAGGSVSRAEEEENTSEHSSKRMSIR